MFSWTSITAILCLGWFTVLLHAAPLPYHRETEPGEVVEVEIAKAVKMKFCWIPAGESHLGSPDVERQEVLQQLKKYKVAKEDEGEPAWLSSEAEQKRGNFTTNGFWLGKYAVTQEQWEAVMGNNPSWFSKRGGGKDIVQGLDTKRFPVEQVNWDDCQEFLKKLNKTVTKPSSLRNIKFGLPHEDEWEYACRGGLGNYQPFYFGKALLGTQANCDGNYPYGTNTKGTYLKRTTAVGSYEHVSPHPWGLCDMNGNVWQWCKNKYDDQAIRRVLRGGCWFSMPWYCRAAERNSYAPGDCNCYIGFRVAVLPVLP
jgi:formylglycine-generating enzyme required for sulfatase activity